MGYDAMGNYTGSDDVAAAAPATPRPSAQGLNLIEQFQVAVGLATERQLLLAKNIRTSETPGADMMAMLADQEGFKEGQPGRAQLNTISGDRRFIESLNSAIRSDRSLIDRLSAGGDDAGGATPTEIIQSLSDPRTRGLMTRVLNRIGEDANDDINGEDLSTVIQQSRTQDYAALNTTLQGMGINDPMVAMATDPIGAIGDFLRNPQEGLSTWLNDPSSPLANLSGDTKNILGRLVEMLSGFLKGFAPGGGFLDEFREFGSHYGAVLNAEGHQRGYDGSSPTRADGGTIRVPDSIRPTGALARAASGETPRSAPESVVELARVDRPELQQQTMSGTAFRI